MSATATAAMIHFLNIMNGFLRASQPNIGEDRKSTRLNSSHSQISYAVFCLKKKKQTDDLAQASQSLRRVRLCPVPVRHLASPHLGHPRRGAAPPAHSSRCIRPCTTLASGA